MKSENVLILYRSKYGSTHMYAEHLARLMNRQAIDLDDVSDEELARADRVIFGGAFRNGHILGSKKFLRIVADLPVPKAIFTTCMTAYDEAPMQILRKRTLPDGATDFPLFYTRGRWIPSEMTFLDRRLWRGVLKSLERAGSKPLSLTEQTLKGLDERARDYFDDRYLEPMLRWLQGSEEPGIGLGVTDERILQIVEEGMEAL